MKAMVKVGSALVFTLIVVAIVSTLAFIYVKYAMPTKGRYCRLSTSSKGFKLLSSSCSNGKGSIVLLAINTGDHPVTALMRNVTVCLIGSNGRLACNLYKINVPKLVKRLSRIIKPGEGVKVILNYSIDRLGITVSIKFPWLLTNNGKVIYFTKAARSKVFYVSVSWTWLGYEGSEGLSKSFSIICKNWVSP